MFGNGFLDGAFVGFLIYSPLLFSIFYLSGDGFKNRKTALVYYFEKNEDVTIFAHILWLILMLYPYLFTQICIYVAIGISKMIFKSEFK